MSPADAALVSQALQRHPVFAGASPAALARLADGASVHALRRGERLVSDGEPATRAYLLVDGSLRVFHASPAGEEVVLMLLCASAIYGEAEALTGGRHVESVAAHERATVIGLRSGALARHLGEDPASAVRLLAAAAERRAIAAYQEKSLAFLPVTIRLANYLVDCLETTRSPALLDLNQDDMAAAISATRRSVAKDVIAWQEAGVLAREGTRYRVRDAAALRRYADPSRLSRAYPVAA